MGRSVNRTWLASAVRDSQRLGGQRAASERLQTSLVEKGSQRCHARVRVGERNVAVGTQQVKRIGREALAFHLGTPPESVQRQLTLRAQRRNVVDRFAVDVNLLVEYCERREVVAAIVSVLDPRQPVAAVDLACRTRVEVAMPIADRRLR